jgi:serine phosphatase RsbU (regulator of sigma subunit)
VGSLARIHRALPLAVLLVVALLDVLMGRDRQVISLVVISPLVAATSMGRRGTAAYGALAVGVAALLGVYDQQYTAEEVTAQVIRLFGIASGTVAALVASTLRMRREAEVARLSAEAAMTRGVVDAAETLQRHLLGDPPVLPGLESAVRYLPASRHSQVGGDWHDGFARPDGLTVLAIGDVAGHDAAAAATMAEVRGMLRALALSAGSPSAVLSGLDRTMAGVAVPALITAVVATVEPRGETVCLRWSNAGHPAPVLLRADGGTELLDRAPQLLLGVSTSVERRDHEVHLQPGDTVLLYTDGLVERRTSTLDDGFAWLSAELAQWAGVPLEQLCDRLLAALGGRVEDDVALLAVRVPARPAPGG